LSAGLTIDTSGAKAKIRLLQESTSANAHTWRWILQNFGAESVRALIKAVGSKLGKSKSGKGRTGQLERNIGFKQDGMGVTIGTGLYVGQREVKYAEIQDRGGTTRPAVTPKMRKFAWATFYETGDEKWKWLALTKKTNLTVNIPASEWFSSTMDLQVKMLEGYLTPEFVLRVAGRFTQ
jgi:hypothetical protein